MKCNNCNATQATPLLSCPDTAVCGADFCPERLAWGKEKPIAFYADKIFSAHKATGSSIFYPLNTAVAADNFVSNYELTPCSGCGCCCANGLSADAVFEIQKSYVELDCFSVDETTAPGAPSTVITPANVTVNGAAVAAVTQENGRYTADISNIIGELLNPVCTAQCLPSEAFILLQDIGTLEFRVRFGFEGVVRSCGALYRFKVYIANNEAIALPEGQTTSFAIAKANIPCIEYGNAPVLSFRFGGTAQVINPQMSVTVTDETDTCNGVTVNLIATLGITPLVFAEVVRNTLILVNGSEGKNDCACGMDGFELYAGQDCCNPPSEPTPKPTPSRPLSSGVIQGCGCLRNGN
ncbi:MAG: hypothetical protein J6B54_00725 [Clostridia bacterium]|nr:hypothetical protein [Clostridia bacterium]